MKPKQIFWNACGHHHVPLLYIASIVVLFYLIHHYTPQISDIGKSKKDVPFFFDVQ
jgi:hypothetical protein